MYIYIHAFQRMSSMYIVPVSLNKSVHVIPSHHVMADQNLRGGGVIQHSRTPPPRLNRNTQVVLTWHPAKGRCSIRVAVFIETLSRVLVSSLPPVIPIPFPLFTHPSIPRNPSLPLIVISTSSMSSSFHPSLLSPSSIFYYFHSVPHPGYAPNHLTPLPLPATLLTSAQGELQEYGHSM